MIRTVVLGGAGNFGARIVAALRTDPDIELIVAGRHAATNVAGLRQEVLDIGASELGARLKTLSPQLVIHCVGPFQGQGYEVARASLAAGAHYLDLADGRRFVADFPAAINEPAIAVQRSAITGASTLPALSSTVVEELRTGLQALESIEVVIAPGQRAPRGTATLAAIFTYLGRPFATWREGRWAQAWGWMNLRRIRLDIGERLAASCDVPDLELFPAHFRGVQTVTFQAALEFGTQHLALWTLAALRRVGCPLAVSAWAARLNRWASLFDSSAGETGGMLVRVVGRREDGRRAQRTWQLTAPALNGPEIPCLPAILLARRLARGQLAQPGAHACMGFLSLSDFAPEFLRLGITTRTEEVGL